MHRPASHPREAAAFCVSNDYLTAMSSTPTRSKESQATGLFRDQAKEARPRLRVLVDPRLTGYDGPESLFTSHRPPSNHCSSLPASNAQILSTPCQSHVARYDSWPLGVVPETPLNTKKESLFTSHRPPSNHCSSLPASNAQILSTPCQSHVARYDSWPLGVVPETPLNTKKHRSIVAISGSMQYISYVSTHGGIVLGNDVSCEIDVSYKCVRNTFCIGPTVPSAPVAKWVSWLLSIAGVAASQNPADGSAYRVRLLEEEAEPHHSTVGSTFTALCTTTAPSWSLSIDTAKLAVLDGEADRH
nr:hypothetical protein CFP56_16251 [Quercus suber]